MSRVFSGLSNPRYKSKPGYQIEDASGFQFAYFSVNSSRGEQIGLDGIEIKTAYGTLMRGVAQDE